MSFYFGDSPAATTTGKPVCLLKIAPLHNPFHQKHHRNMKSSQLLNIPSTAVVPRIRRSKSFAALFAAALAMGLGVGSVLAQGPYYPQVAPLGGAPFVPSGVPVVSNAELNLIESKMIGNATLVIPALAPKHAATLAEYKAAVQAAATDVANGVGGPVTITSLAAEVAAYRQAGASQVIDGLGSFAAGIIASSSGTKAADLQGLVLNAAKTNPAAVNSGNLFLQVFNAAAADNTLVTGIGALVNSALTGAVAGTPPSAALGSTGVKSVIYNALNAIGNAPTGNANTANNALKGGLITGLVATVIPTIAGSPVDLSQATSTLTGINVTTYVTTSAMVSVIKGSVVASNLNYGAIAQGALLGLPSASAAIKAALGTSYTNDLIDAYNAFATPASAGGLALTYDPVAVAAAGGTKFPGSAAAIVKDILSPLSSNASGLLAQDIIGRGVAAAVGQPAQNIAAAAVGANALVTLSDVVTGATLAAPIGSAGAIARAVAVAPLAGGLTAANATLVGNAAIAAAATVASPSNKPDAYADIAYSLASTGGNAAYQNNAITAEAQAIATANGGPATAPTYIAIVAAAAGSAANRATILSTGAGAVAGDDDAASTAGVNLLTSLSAGGALSKYQVTLAAVATAGNDARNLALLYAAELGNTADAAGGLAALIANTATNATDLTTAAISANRLIRANLKVASDVAVYMKANPNGNIQAYVGHQILDNPSFTKEISVAATTVTPQWSHVIAHTVAFDAPKAVVDSISGIFLHSRIPLLNGAVNYVNDRPAAVAAITAALATGILENTITPTFTAADRKLALQNSISKSMTAIVSGGFTSTSFNDATAGPATFRQSNGIAGGSSPIKASGAAGAVTGFVAQLVTPNVNAIDPDALGALTAAMAAAAQYTGGAFIYDIAQAAGQAFGWVSGVATSGAGAVVANQIANAINLGFPSWDLANPGKVLNAVNFGIDEAKGGEIGANPLRLPGAGAGGLRDIIFNAAAPFYDHHTASGRPVSNIFSL